MSKLTSLLICLSLFYSVSSWAQLKKNSVRDYYHALTCPQGSIQVESLLRAKIQTEFKEAIERRLELQGARGMNLLAADWEIELNCAEAYKNSTQRQLLISIYAVDEKRICKLDFETLSESNPRVQWVGLSFERIHCEGLR